MGEILGVGRIDSRRVSDALSIRGHDSGQEGETCTYHRDLSHDITCGFTGEKNDPQSAARGWIGMMQLLISGLHMPCCELGKLRNVTMSAPEG
jgi:hypothetical protein